MDSLAVSPAVAALRLGDTLRMTLTTSGTLVGRTPTWTSTDTAVVSVDVEGRVVARWLGQASVTVSIDAHRDSSVITVEPPRPVQRTVPAFPGARGFGAHALMGCREKPVVVHRVETLSSDTFRQIIRNDLSDDAYDIVVFDTGGTIALDGGVTIAASCVYIAGQTAPGGGIQLRAADDPEHQIQPVRLPREAPEDIVLRFMRVRAGRGASGDADNIQIVGGRDVMIDHVSTAWGNDESISLFPVRASFGGLGVDNVTIQWSVVAATLRPHSTGVLIGGAPDEGPYPTNISVHHNAFIHNSHRNPLVRRVERIETVNNLVYNWRNRVGYFEDRSSADVIGQYWKRGPWSGNMTLAVRIDQAQGFTDTPTLYLDGNVGDPWQLDAGADQTAFVIYDGDLTGDLPASAFVAAPQANPAVPVRVQAAHVAYENILEVVGASHRLTCAGDWVESRDSTDDLFLQQVVDGTGPATDEESDHQDDFGGYPELAAGEPCLDTDQDGLPDAFEIRYGMNPERADGVFDTDSDGYLDIEEYLNGTDPRN